MMGELQPLAARCMDGCCAGQTGPVHMQLLLAQHLLAVAAMFFGSAAFFAKADVQTGQPR